MSLASETSNEASRHRGKELRSRFGGKADPPKRRLAGKNPRTWAGLGPLRGSEGHLSRAVDVAAQELKKEVHGSLSHTRYS